VRFQNALFERSQNARMSLTSLAYACGYYDQSHMVHDFKVLTGMTPKHFFEDCPPYSDYFA
jgi:AraC-like DNA-binding protein